MILILFIAATDFGSARCKELEVGRKDSSQKAIMGGGNWPLASGMCTGSDKPLGLAELC